MEGISDHKCNGQLGAGNSMNRVTGPTPHRERREKVESSPLGPQCLILWAGVSNAAKVLLL